MRECCGRTSAGAASVTDDHGNQRIDVELVRRGLAVSRAQAAEAISAGRVRVNGQAVRKAALKVCESDAIEFEPAHPWVSRGGVKLAHALDVFGVSVEGKPCLDVGASTGGFTEVLLSQGARRVVAVDVGRDQLHARLRSDERVCSLEATDARGLTPAMIGEAPELVVCDASFIGLDKVLETPLGLAAKDAELVALFKPQFEVGPAHIGKGGIVSADEAVIGEARERFAGWAETRGWRVERWAEAPIAGGDGNQEWLAYACRHEPKS